jgi:hypothetical protein
MKKQDIIQNIVNRFSNLPQDVSVVVTYKGEKYSILPYKFQYKSFFDYFTIEKLKPFMCGEIIEEQKELCGNPEFQFLTFRAEAPCDFFRFAFHCSENNEDIMFDSFQQSHSWEQSHKGKLAAPSHLSLIQIKELMWELADKYNIPDTHILIQSLDYPIFNGKRDRNSPQPIQNNLVVSKELVSL